MVDSSEDITHIQLGDILKILAPDNTTLNNRILYVSYIDSEKIVLISETSPLTPIILKLTEKGYFEDPRIEGIEILSRAEFPGYAKQNNLTLGTWINIYFGGEVPFILVGQITDLEQDSIEITSYPDNDIIYIDFAYQGIPEDLLIEKIIIRKSPIQKTDDTVLPQVEAAEEFETVKAGFDYQAGLRTIYIDADQINFGPDLEDIVQTVDVPETEKRYSIQQQITDLLDDLLSYVPTFKRTPDVENNIHTMIERFKQLRMKYSRFDENGNANLPNPTSESYKPIIKSILNLNKQFSWLLPVSKNKKNMYDLETEVLEDIQSEAINPLVLGPILKQEEKLIKMYKKGTFSEDENKYRYLFRSLNRYETPFTDPNNIEDLIYSQRVNTNILSIVNNLDNLYALVSSNTEGFVEKKKFYFDTYTLGLSYIKEKNVSPLTPNDRIAIQSFITLPFSTLLYSTINLPTTNILAKTELNMNNLDYWQIFTKNKTVAQEVIIDTFNDFNYTQNTFLNNITSFILSESLHDEDDAYEKYLNVLIPKTLNIFNLVKEKIKNKYSVYSVVKFLELFMIYYDDIIFEQYEVLVDFVQQEISKYEANYIADFKKYNSLFKKSTSKKSINSLLKLIAINDEIETIILDAYGISRDNNYSDAEILKIILNIDYGNLFISTLIKIDFDLQTSNLVDNFIKSYEEFISERKALQNTCKIIVKKYNDIPALEADNNKEIYADKEFDKTDPPKSVEDGEYAILILPIVVSEEPRAEYYVRDQSQWKRDDTINDTAVIKDNKLFCNLQEPCISSSNKSGSKCDNLNTKKYSLDDETLKIILNEFDSTFGAKEGEILDVINSNIIANRDRIKYLKKWEAINFLKYDTLKKQIGYTIQSDELDLTTSPHEDLRDIILAQADFRKKQFDIQRFVVNFTREPYSDEDSYWLYSKKTDTKLLPVFLSYLANIYFSGEDYLFEIDVICAKQGTISDDGDKWVDKHSGYTIKDIDYDTEEGFTEEGFKLKTREVLEKDLGNAVLEGTSKKEAPETPESKKIRNIIKTITREISIDTSHLNDFILRNVLTIYETIKPNKKDYNERRDKAIKAGKTKIPTYDDSINISYSTLTFVFLLVAIQISVPKIISRKTFPGCKPSLRGYPFEGSDRTALTYIACIAFKLSRNSEDPWVSLFKIKEAGIIKHMEQLIKDYVINDPEIRERFFEKREYLKMHDTGEHIAELDIHKLINFLPPLQSFKLKQLEPLSTAFKTRLFQYIYNGSYLQHDDILVIKSKIFYFSLSIQEKIQKIIDKISPILTNFTGHSPFLENACCQEESTKFLQYFTSRDKSILANNSHCIRNIKSSILLKRSDHSPSLI